MCMGAFIATKTQKRKMFIMIWMNVYSGNALLFAMQKLVLHSAGRRRRYAFSSLFSNTLCIVYDMGEFVYM